MQAPPSPVMGGAGGPYMPMDPFAAARQAAEETVLAMLSEDDFGRGDVVSTLASLASVYPGRTSARPSGRSLDGSAVSLPATEAAELIARQRAALRSLATWKSRDRTKTMAVGMIVCLNIGTDPPDVVRVPPHAKEHCWIDPGSMPPQRALDAIGSALHAQYERLQPKAKFKLSLDPTMDDVKKLAASLRKSCRDDRVLLHYNGHGVPAPTPTGAWCAA